MRLRTICFMTLSITAAQPNLSQADYTDEVLADGPVGYWSLNETSGTQAFDLSGNANHGAYDGTILGVPGSGCGPLDFAATFDDDAGRIVVPDDASLDLTNVTMEAWVLWCGPNTLQQRVMERSFGNPTAPEYGLSILDTGEVRVELRGADNQYFVTSETIMTAGTWTHLAATYDGSIVRIYIDGVLDHAETINAGDLLSSNANLGIGNQANRDRPWNGTLDEVALYGHALSADRILAHYQACSPPVASSCPSAQSVKLYWTDYGTDRIQCADLDGSNVTNLVTTGLSFPFGIAVDAAAGLMYWSEANSDRIERAFLDGSGRETVVGQGLQTPDGLALDVGAGKIYWSDRGTDKIQRANLDGTDVEDLVTVGLTSVSGIALDLNNGHMYWADGGTEDRIQRSKLDGFSIETIITDTFNPNGVTLDLPTGKIYWAESGRIRRANMDGTNIEDLVTGLDLPRNIVLHGGKMYWTDNGTVRIQRANLDGSAVETLITDLEDPYGLALGPVEAPVSSTPIPGQPIGGADETEIGDGFTQVRLGASVPNPFHRSNSIEFELAAAQSVRLSIIEASGRKVRDLVSGQTLAAGRHVASWDGQDEEQSPVAAGVYFYRLEAGDEVRVRSVVKISR